MRPMFRLHILEYYGQPSFDCHLCPMVFPLEEQLISHLQIHGEEPVYRCPHCDATFKSKGWLSKHLKSHHAV
ncbi:hypothetical protein MTO96_010192 [Rhipicephalus appendiculatus]